MNKDKIFNTSDSRTFELKETNSELYKEIKERATEAKKSLNEQGLEIAEETGKFHYYEDDSDD